MPVVERQALPLASRLIQRGTFRSWSAPVLVGLLAVLVRLGFLLANGGLHSAIEYDDGVHYGSALLLLHGKIPYRDFVFLQPPGITLLLTPAAGLGRITSPFVGFAAARILTATVAGFNAVLLAKLVSRQSSMRRGVVAGALYAVSAPAIVAGSTVMIEPWLSLLMLLSLNQLFGGDQRRRAGVYAGLFAGLALALKVWAGAFALLLVVALLWERRPGEARRVLLSAAATVSVVFTPFLLLSPKSLLTDVLTAQATRPAAGIQGAAARWEDFTGLSSLSHNPVSEGLSVAAIAAVAACLVQASRSGALGRLLALQAIGAAIIFSLARPYFTHYGEYLTVFLAPSVALALPKSLPDRLKNSPGITVTRIATAGLVIFLGSWSTLQAVDVSRRATPSSVSTAKLSRIVAHSHCVVSDDMTLAILANASTQCAWPDPRGTALTMLHGHAPKNFYPLGFRSLKPWQQEWRRRLSEAEIAILSSSPCNHREWIPALCAYVTDKFRLITNVGTVGPQRLEVQVWKRR